MKKLGKLTIDAEKMIKNKELVNLKGGYGGGGSITCECKDSSGYVHLTETIDDCDKEDRWIENTCWAIHQPYSGCDCVIA